MEAHLINTMITRVHGGVMETLASAVEPLDLYTDSFCIALPLDARVPAVARSQRKKRGCLNITRSHTVNTRNLSQLLAP